MFLGYHVRKYVYKYMKNIAIQYPFNGGAVLRLSTNTVFMP